MLTKENQKVVAGRLNLLNRKINNLPVKSGGRAAFIRSELSGVCEELQLIVTTQTTSTRVMTGVR